MSRARSVLATASIAAILAVVFGTVATACADRGDRGWDWNRMRKQPRYEPYGASSVFADGKVMQAPPAGTVSREAAVEPVSIKTIPASVRRGGNRFQIFCAACHGERGDGNSVVASNMDRPKPPSLLAEPARALSTEQLVAIVTNGFGRMPSFAAELSPTDREAVALYVKDLQRAETQRGDIQPGAPRRAVDSMQTIRP